MSQSRPIITTAHWRLWFMLIALATSIPAFYDTLMPNPASWSLGLYVASALWMWASTWRPVQDASQPQRKLLPRLQSWHADRALGAALFSCALLPYGHDNSGTLSWRLLVELTLLVRLMVLSQPLWASTGLVRLTIMAAAVLGMCGVGFYWIDPQITSVGDGLWLAFTTAATVGFGDVVPNTTASRIFSVFVVLLGYGVLSLVTASIAAMFVGSQERKVEQEILRDMHAQLRSVRQEIAELRAAIHAKEKAESAHDHSAL